MNLGLDHPRDHQLFFGGCVDLFQQSGALRHFSKFFVERGKGGLFAARRSSTFFIPGTTVDTVSVPSETKTVATIAAATVTTTHAT